MIDADDRAVPIWKNTQSWARKHFTFDQYAARKSAQYSKHFSECVGSTKMAMPLFEREFQIGE